MNSRFQNIFLLLKSFVFFPFRGFAKGEVQTPQKVIVFQGAKLGDMVCTTPVFRALKATYPHVLLTVVGNSLNREVLAYNHDVDAYISYDKFSTKELIRLIRQENFDFGCTVVPDFRALSAMYLGGVRVIAVPRVEGGWSPYETKPYVLLRHVAETRPHTMYQYAPREYMRLLEPLSITNNDTTKRLGYSDAARLTIEKFLHDKNVMRGEFALISPSAGNKIKNWPAERFAQVAEYFIARHIPVIIIGGKRDTEEVAAMVAALHGQRGVINVSELFSLDELKALIAQAKIFVSVDTGPLYIAEAFNVPTVDILGPMSEQEQPPRSEKNRVVFDHTRRAPQLHIMNARMYNRVEARRQVEAISVEMVIHEIVHILG